jgi:hypothetical protein
VSGRAKAKEKRHTKARFLGTRGIGQAPGLSGKGRRESDTGHGTRNKERKREKERERERKPGHWSILETDFLANSSACGPVSQEPSNQFRAHFGGVLVVASHHGNTNKSGPTGEYFGREIHFVGCS